MVIPDTFGTRGERIISSFDYYDVASGVGYEQFWLMTAQDNSSTDYILIDNTSMYSAIVETASATTLTFDSSTFNLPRTVKGTAYFNIGLRSNLSVAGVLSAKVQKWDGSNATDITSTHTITVPTGDITGKILCFEMPCTEKIIKKGENLRLVVTTTGTGVIAIGHDPKNRDEGNMQPSSQPTITSANINIPFKINL